jgi:hypothetical protein
MVLILIVIRRSGPDQPIGEFLGTQGWNSGGVRASLRR